MVPRRCCGRRRLRFGPAQKFDVLGNDQILRGAGEQLFAPRLLLEVPTRYIHF
jgi:hypothetical protein